MVTKWSHSSREGNVSRFGSTTTSFTGDDPIAVDVYLTRAQAEQALDDAVADEPEWAERLRVEKLELDERAVSLN